MAELNSRWRGAQQKRTRPRYSTERTVEDARWIPDRAGHKQLERDRPHELRFIERRHEGAGWRHGARVRVGI